jgi:hypothetical protein
VFDRWVRGLEDELSIVRFAFHVSGLGDLAPDCFEFDLVVFCLFMSFIENMVNDIFLSKFLDFATLH